MKPVSKLYDFDVFFSKTNVRSLNKIINFQFYNALVIDLFQAKFEIRHLLTGFYRLAD